MNKKTFLFAAAVVLFAVAAASAQKPRLGKICGDPNVKCVGTEDFQPWALTFALPKNAVIYQSEVFYAVILKSVKLKDSDDCSVVFPEDERLPVQELFPKNKVFAMKCFDAGEISYSNVANNVAFLGVFGGKTMADANAILAKVKATGKFPGAMIRRMHAEINGT